MRPTLFLLLALTACAGAVVDKPADTDADDTDVVDTDDVTAPDTDGQPGDDTDALDTDVADQDGDGLTDAFEGLSQGRDTDGDGTLDALDTDSDNDCIPDSLERLASPADLDGDGDPDAVDRDSDGDGVADGLEDMNCSGIVEDGETDPHAVDSDGDGATDLIEVVMGTSGVDANDLPDPTQVRVVVVPDGVTPTPTSVDLPLRSALPPVDVYLLLDRSGSMSTELHSIRDNMATELDALRCPPLGSGMPGSCIDDLWAGAGTVGYFDVPSSAYQNAVDVSSSPNFLGVPITEPVGTSSAAEDFSLALWAAASGQGGAGLPSCSLPALPARATCVGSPAQSAGYGTFGYGCFRESALTVIVAATDEAPLQGTGTTHCPDWSTVTLPELWAHDVRVLGLVGSGAAAEVRQDLEQMATDTHAVDALNGNAPLVFDVGASAATALGVGLRSLVDGFTSDLSLEIADDPSDAVDVRSVVERVETAQLPGQDCAAGLVTVDLDHDTFPDSYVGVAPRTGVCWSITLAASSPVIPTAEVQVYKGTARLVSERGNVLDARDLVVIVPPDLSW